MFIQARHLYFWFLNTFGYVAIVNPFSLVCHVLPEYLPLSHRLKTHEQTHFAQIKREGRLKFCIKYLYYNLRYGYRNNPYEIEAREASGEDEAL